MSAVIKRQRAARFPQAEILMVFQILCRLFDDAFEAGERFSIIKSQLSIICRAKNFYSRKIIESRDLIIDSSSSMKKIIFILFILCLSSSGAFTQTNSASAIEAVPATFKSDGCSLFPDCDYRDCCVEHDKAYYVGGNWKMRWRADKKLFKCVAAKKGFQHKTIAPLMWLGVRVGGVSRLPTSFRWGFGRKKSPK